MNKYSQFILSINISLYLKIYLFHLMFDIHDLKKKFIAWCVIEFLKSCPS